MILPIHFFVTFITYNNSNKITPEKDVLTALPSDLSAAEHYHDNDNIPFLTPPVHHVDGEGKDHKDHPEDEVGIVH